MSDEVMLDLDHPMAASDWKVLGHRILVLLAILGLKIEGSIQHRTTVHGLHVWFILSAPVPCLTIVAMQAILGSDWKRESFNLMRAMQLADAPTFWQSRSNVLYASKLKEE